MSETPADRLTRLAQTFEGVEDALLSRWPETRLEPSLDRIRAFTALLGDPQRGYPVIQLTGTNGKTSTSRMIETLVRALDLRAGRFSSPHLERMTERISLDGEPLTDDEFGARLQRRRAVPPDRRRQRGAPGLVLRNRRRDGVRRVRGRPGRRGRGRGRGIGGSWDATNVADAAVAVVLPVAVDHAAYLGDTPAAIAVEKAGIIKPGSIAVLAQQQPEVAAVLRRAGRGGGCERRSRGRRLRRGLAGAGGRWPGHLPPGPAGALRRPAAPALRCPPGAERRRGAGRGRGVRGRRRDRRRGGARGVRCSHVAGSTGGRAAQPHDRARRRAQPARRRGERGCDRGLLHVLAADRRDRRDGRQGPRGSAHRVRAAPGPCRLHPELDRARAPGGPAGCGRPGDLRRRPRQRRAAPGRRHRAGGHPGRGRGGVRRPARLGGRARDRVGDHGRRGARAAVAASGGAHERPGHRDGPGCTRPGCTPARLHTARLHTGSARRGAACVPRSSPSRRSRWASPRR